MTAKMSVGRVHEREAWANGQVERGARGHGREGVQVHPGCAGHLQGHEACLGARGMHW